MARFTMPHFTLRRGRALWYPRRGQGFWAAAFLALGYKTGRFRSSMGLCVLNTRPTHLRDLVVTGPGRNLALGLNSSCCEPR
jgi:hypothetical protein